VPVPAFPIVGKHVPCLNLRLFVQTSSEWIFVTRRLFYSDSTFHPVPPNFRNDISFWILPSSWCGPKIVQVTENGVTPLRFLCACYVAQPLLTFCVRRTQPRVQLVVGGCRQPLVRLLPAVLAISTANGFHFCSPHTYSFFRALTPRIFDRNMSLVLVAKSWERCSCTYTGHSYFPPVVGK